MSADDHNGTFGADHDVLADAAEDDLFCLRQTAAAHDDEVGAHVVGMVEDAAGGIADVQANVGSKSRGDAPLGIAEDRVSFLLDLFGDVAAAADLFERRHMCVEVNDIDERQSGTVGFCQADGIA